MAGTGTGYTSGTGAHPTTAQRTSTDMSQMMAMLQKLSLDVQALQSSQGSNQASASTGSTTTDAITAMTGLMT